MRLTEFYDLRTYLLGLTNTSALGAKAEEMAYKEAQANLEAAKNALEYGETCLPPCRRDTIWDPPEIISSKTHTQVQPTLVQDLEATRQGKIAISFEGSALLVSPGIIGCVFP